MNFPPPRPNQSFTNLSLTICKDHKDRRQIAQDHTIVCAGKFEIQFLDLCPEGWTSCSVSS
eukprot:796402-Amphidinium_carterae.1